MIDIPLRTALPIHPFMLHRTGCQPVPEHVTVFFFIYAKTLKKGLGPLTLVFTL
jgi:hypothetical protein